MSTPQPLVSVVIPAHNAASHLAHAVGSALAQTMRALEVIIVDDASSDATAEVAHELARGDPRVVVVRAPRNLGPAGARNLGLARARGAWIALLDSDDAFEPCRIAHLFGTAEARGADMVADNLQLCDGAAPGSSEIMLPASLLAAPRQIDAADFLIGNLPVRGHPRVSYGFLKPLMRRAFLEAQRLRYDERLRFAEDFDLYLRCLLAGASFWLIPEAGYLYSVRGDSVTAKHTARDLARLRAVDRRLLRRAEVAHKPRLARALRQHARSIDRRLIWRLFTDAVKQRQWRRAFRAATLSPMSGSFVAWELARLAPRLAARWCRRVTRPLTLAHQ